MTRVRKSGTPLVAVLGASGLVGSAVTAALITRDIRLRAVARRPAAIVGSGPAEVEVRTADLTDRAALTAAIADADVLIHLVKSSVDWRAVTDDPASRRVNVGILTDIVDIVRSSGRPPLLVYGGAVSQAGATGRSRIDGREPDRPRSPYDRQKLAAERVLESATTEGVLRGISLRLATVFGPCPLPREGDHGVVAAMVRQALAGQALSLWHSGEVRRDLLYVDDVAAAVLAAVDHADELAGRRWLIGADRSMTLGDLFELIAGVVAEVTGRPPVAVHRVPPPPGAPVTDFHSLTVDSSAFRAVTGWRPQAVLRDALTRTVVATMNWSDQTTPSSGSGKTSLPPRSR